MHTASPHYVQLYNMCVFTELLYRGLQNYADCRHNYRKRFFLMHSARIRTMRTKTKSDRDCGPDWPSVGHQRATVFRI